MKHLVLCLSMFLIGTGSLQATERESMGSSGKSLVYSCTVVFPNDSDVFQADRIKSCIKNIDPLQVTYVHVVATATTTGTSEHNLDLSNRRAAAVGNFITRAFPKVQDIQFFGGGQNPRLGRQARVFIIVQPEQTQDEPEPTEPQVIHEVEIKHETKTVTVTRSARGFEAIAQYGAADVEHYEFAHRYLSFGIRQPNYWNDRQDLIWTLGVHVSQYQSTLRRDFEALHGEAGLRKLWSLSKPSEYKVFAQGSALAGVTTNHDKAALDFGLRLEGGMEKSGLRLGLTYAHAHQLKQLGLMLGIDF